MPEAAEVFTRAVATELGEGISVTAKRDPRKGDMIVRCLRAADPPKLIICIDEEVNELLTRADREERLARIALIASAGWRDRAHLPISEEYGGAAIRIISADLVSKALPFIRSYDGVSATNEAMRAFEDKHAGHRGQKGPEGNQYVTRCLDCGVEFREDIH